MTPDYRRETSSKSTTSTHDKVYSSLLAAVGFLFVFGIVTQSRLRHRLPADSGGIDVFLLAIEIEACYLAAILAVLVIRIGFPLRRRWPTFALNIILLPYVPFGTALGIYGLWKVDRKLAKLAG